MLTNLLTLPYQLVVCLRLWLYKRGWMTSHRLPRPVVSVGNLTVGGTGKTPMTMWVAQYLTARGKKVAILSRGYRRHSQEKFLVVSNGKDILVSPGEAGDEPFLMASRCPGVIVAVGANRYQLGCWVLEQLAVDCFVLDDGFQHVNLHRDLNLLLVDVSDTAGMQALLPFGRLREPLSEAQRATKVIFTRVENLQDMEPMGQRLEMAVGRSIDPIATRMEAEGLMCGNGDLTKDLSWLRGKRVFIFSGVANAPSFRRLVERLGAQVVDERIFSDHTTYSLETLSQIHERAAKVNAQVLLTTEKDLVKVKPLWTYPDPVWALSVGIQFLEGQDRLEAQLLSI
ncbi:MAG: tetraacyldisaccharide 4'-kinase [Nitrospirae bacterium]|nr:tetraacyldisaccharide 4'-kinase [Nitrospirota bacterium]MDA1303650.1 tetraacyldisaccharide 4'-kinase [Nitrospirota bacterium]